MSERRPGSTDPKPLVPPIEHSVSFAFGDTTGLAEVSGGAHRERFYSRLGNPTTRRAEEAIAALEGAEDALCLSSGMAAVSTLALGLLSQGDRVLVDRRSYGGTASFFKFMAPRLGIEVIWFGCESEAFQLLDPSIRLLYLETPTNPLLELVDLRLLAAAAREHGALSVCDSTLATPHGQSPLDCGVSLVLHSATKALNGHHDVLAGAICGSSELIEQLRETRALLGGCLSAGQASLLLRGLQTFTLRVERQQQQALELARMLSARPELSRVLYPGLPGHPQHALARRQMRRFTNVVSIEFEAGLEAARRAVDSLERFHIAPSLGGVDSLVTLPALSTHMGWSAEELADVGLSEGLVRLSIGVEPIELLCADLEAAITAAAEG